MSTAIFLGIDIGTSGIRGSAIDENADEIVTQQIAFTGKPVSDDCNAQDPNSWQRLLDELISAISKKLQHQDPAYRINAICIDGTSSTLIACKKDGTALSPALMYNDQQSRAQAEIIRRFAPAQSAVHGASSSLAKALFLLQKYPQTEIFCHQADWLASALTGRYGISDENNCLKLGYDSITQSWPKWLQHNDEHAVIARSRLPKVVPPGTNIGRVKPELIAKYSLANDCAVIAGTTDSNAAVLATGASRTGDAVTSLGSTLVVKIFSEQPVFNPDYGIYSHRLNNHWLAGGSSNSGGAVLLKYFTKAQLEEMTPQLQPGKPTGLDYYPLAGRGERFPVNDSDKTGKIEPRPDSDIEFFQALLEGMASIEAQAYKKLQQLGASKPLRIFTAGGGSKNPAWTKIREQVTGINILPAAHNEASYGSALLARQGYLST